MATLAASIALQIAAIDAQMSTIMATSIASDGTSVTRSSWLELSKRRTQLEGYLARLNGTSPMIVRGVVKGL